MSVHDLEKWNKRPSIKRLPLISTPTPSFSRKFEISAPDANWRIYSNTGKILFNFFGEHNAYVKCRLIQTRQFYWMESTNVKKQQQVKHQTFHLLSFFVLASFKSLWKSFCLHSSTLLVNTSWLKIRRRRAFVLGLPKHPLWLRHSAKPWNKMHNLVIEEFWRPETEFHSLILRFSLAAKMVRGMKKTRVLIG